MLGENNVIQCQGKRALYTMSEEKGLIHNVWVKWPYTQCQGKRALYNVWVK